MHRALTPLLLAGALAAGSPAWSAPAPAAPKTVTVPMRIMRTGHFTVGVRVNGKGPFRLVMDTGSPVTFITARAAQKVGLLTAAAAKKPALLGMRGQSQAASFKVGACEVKDLPILLLDHPVIDMLSQVEGPIDGIVGFSFFARFRTTIDYEAARVTFAPTRYAGGDVVSDLTSTIGSRRPTERLLTPAAQWGLEVEALPAPAEGAEGEPARGVRIKRVYEGGASAAAGLREGDVLLEIDGSWTDSVTDTLEAVARTRAGTPVAVRVQRDGEELKISVRPRAGL
ncbi:MAG: PDZ domain-containing protein [Armatimonadota bacterium]